MACKILVRSSGTAYSEEVKNSIYFKGAVVGKGTTDKQLGVLEHDKNQFIQITISDTVAGECTTCLNCCLPKTVDDEQTALACFYMNSVDVDTVVAAGGSATMTKAEFEAKITEIA